MDFLFVNAGVGTALKRALYLTRCGIHLGMVNRRFTPARTQALRAGRAEAVVHGKAARLGVVTPLSACTAMPLALSSVYRREPMQAALSLIEQHVQF